MSRQALSSRCLGCVKAAADTHTHKHMTYVPVFALPSSAQTRLPPPQQPSFHLSTPAPVSPLTSVGLGGGVIARQQLVGLEISEGQVPQSQPAALQRQPTARLRTNRLVKRDNCIQLLCKAGPHLHQNQNKARPQGMEQNWMSL